MLKKEIANSNIENHGHLEKGTEKTPRCVMLNAIPEISLFWVILGHVYY